MNLEVVVLLLRYQRAKKPYLNYMFNTAGRREDTMKPN